MLIDAFDKIWKKFKPDEIKTDGAIQVNQTRMNNIRVAYLNAINVLPHNLFLAK